MKIIICGICGKMGQNVFELLSTDGAEIVCGVDTGSSGKASVPVYKSFEDIKESADAIIDFSSPSVLKSEMEWAIEHNIPVVLATTGYSTEQLDYIDGCAKKIPVFKTANFSLGVNLLVKLVKKTAEALGENFDIEIIEKHHNRKADAPSGTALMLAEGANSAFGDKKEYLNGRDGIVGKRGKEIGIHAVRGGTIVGEHEVLFAGEDEIITLSHSARSKKVFAAGAVKAAKWIVGKPAGKYDMTDVLENP
ncbi:MAG: 4-hydroxy-tetrahydrodipicolinate reductase [Clostridiales bacterium]|nr:4-hydroxy-tetrahydrodipicolinate reductase [Clostridiales bacterium]